VKLPALLIPVLLLGACGAARPPRVEVVGMTQEPSGVVRVGLLARNDHGEELDVRLIRYAVSIDGREVFRGERAGEAAIRRFGTQELDVPAPAEPGAAGRSYRVRGEIEYFEPEAIWQTLYETGVRRPTSSFSGEGVIAPTP
jgi:hypothetical protein